MILSELIKILKAIFGNTPFYVRPSRDKCDINSLDENGNVVYCAVFIRNIKNNDELGKELNFINMNIS